MPVPEDSKELSELSTKLMQYNVSLKMYADSYTKDDVRYTH